MAPDPRTLSIVHHPAEVLRRKAEPVGEVTDEIRAVGSRMIELMREAEGIGLAAPQVGLSIRMFVADVPPHENDDTTGLPTASDGPRLYIDPVFSEPDKTFESLDEGCLSLPNITGEVRRPRSITITYTDPDGVRRSEAASGLLARCWQHESDHLDGVLIIDRMSQMSRLRIRSALRDLEKRASR
ncbi:MAG: peptide deformylase [Planctomycetota bacterium]